MKKNVFTVALLTAALAVLGWCVPKVPASAQVRLMCAPKSTIERVVKGQYKETRVGQGHGAAAGAIVVLYVSENRSWTLVRYLPSGMGCVIGFGLDWSSRKLPIKGAKET